MSEIRPASQRPEQPRVHQERPVKTEQKVKNDPPPKMEPQREVVQGKRSDQMTSPKAATSTSRSKF